MKKKNLLFGFALCIISCNTELEKKISEDLSSEQRKDSSAIKKIFNSVLKEGKSYEWLRDLTQNIGGRLSGSPEAAEAVVWGEKLMNQIEFLSI